MEAKQGQEEEAGSAGLDEGGGVSSSSAGRGGSQTEPAAGCGSKRLLSMDDPDYTCPPDAKRLRVLQQRAQEELSERVVKVVKRELDHAMEDKQAEVEEIESRILRLQQCLHTLRYCISLQYFSRAMVQSPGKRSDVHPTVRKHLGKAAITRHGSTPNPQDPSHTTVQLTLPSSEAHPRLAEDPTQPPPPSLPPHSQSGDGPCGSSSSSTEGGVESGSQEQGKKLSPCRPPSPKYLPPKPPDDPESITQGARHHKFQSKKRVVVGNTYQYLAHEDGGEALRYKWQLYVRGPTLEADISSFVSSVTFVLDQSYTPHDIITLKQPPFVLIRRGWGQFKVKIMLNFVDGRNKQVTLLHPLVLSRVDDPLGLTGLWRLGQEKWYDLWVYTPGEDKSAASSMGAEGWTGAEEDDNCPAPLTRELVTGVVSSQVGTNITVQHDGEQSILPAPSLVSPGDAVVKTEPTSPRQTDTAVGSQQPATAPAPVQEGEQATKVKTEAAGVNGVQGKLCKIQVRQPDGRLIPYFIPAHMYSLALKIAQGTNTKTSEKSATSGNNIVGQQSVAGKQTVTSVTSRLPNVVSSSAIQTLTVGQEAKEEGSIQQKTPTTTTTALTLQVTSQPSDTKELNKPQRTNFFPNKNVNDAIVRALPTTSSAPASPATSTTVVKVEGAQAGTVKPTPQTVKQLVVRSGCAEGSKFAIVKQVSSEGGTERVRVSQVHISPDSTPKLKSNIQLVPIKIVKELQANTTKGTKIIQKPISAADIRIISNNQLISLGPTGGRVGGEKVVTITSTKTPSPASTPSLPLLSSPSTSSTPCSSAGGAAATRPTPMAGLVVQGGRVVRGAGVLQLVSSQGRVAGTQMAPVKATTTTSTRGPLPLVIREVSNSPKVVTSSSRGEGSQGGVGKTVSLLWSGVSPSLSPLKPGTALLKIAPSPTTTTTTTTTSATVTCSTEMLQGFSLNKVQACAEATRESQQDEAHLHQLRLLEVCKSCRHSAAACVSVGLRAFPLVAPPGPRLLPTMSFCAPSHQHFLSWPLGKQRAAEMQQARLVRGLLDRYQVEGREAWTNRRIMAWARRHAFTPTTPRQRLSTDWLPGWTNCVEQTLSCVGEVEGGEADQPLPPSHSSPHPDIDVVRVDRTPPPSPRRLPGSPVKAEECLVWGQEEGDEEGSAWVSHVASQLRLRLGPEEVATGHLADAARATLWKSVLSLMEDLLRASHSQAWWGGADSPTVPPATLQLSHVLQALRSARPQFDLFTDSSLAVPSEDLT